MNTNAEPLQITPIVVKEGSSERCAVSLRGAQASEIETMLALFEEEVRAGRMLPRSPHEVRANIEDWIVAEVDGQVTGCVSLVFFNGELCEVRSLAVDPGYRGRGLGSRLILAALELAQERGVLRVLTLTRTVSLFERLGFRRDFVANVPEKVWRDCRPCPLRHRCDEVALLYYLEEPSGSGNGNGRRP